MNATPALHEYRGANGVTRIHKEEGRPMPWIVTLDEKIICVCYMHGYAKIIAQFLAYEGEEK